MPLSRDDDVLHTGGEQYVGAGHTGRTGTGMTTFWSAMVAEDRDRPRSAARVTMAVPCWSSCMTGQSRASTTRRSISKQRGAEMSRG